MENHNKRADHKEPKKKILKPSVIHADLPKPEEIKPITEEEDYKHTLPENPERNYHHGVNHIIQDNTEVTRADDDVWNGEDA